MIRRMLTATALVAILSLPGRAEEPSPEPAPAGTAEGAAALRASLGAYLTDVPFRTGILRIEPDPAGQRVTLDPASFLSDVVGAPVRVSPLSVLVSRRSDGDWNVFSRDPVSIAFEAAVAGQPVQSFSYEQSAQTFKGVFSPALAAFLQGEASARDTVSIQKEALSDSSTTVSDTRVSTSARPGEAGGVDLEIRQMLRGYEQTVRIKMPVPPENRTGEGQTGEGQDTDGEEPFAGLPEMRLGFGAGEVEGAASVEGGRTVEIRDLYALLLRHLDALEADPRQALAGPLGPELRAALARLLPVWTSMEARVTARDASFVSPFVRLEAGEARQTTRLTGIAENTTFDTELALEGLKADGAALPPWAAGFVPHEVALGFAVSGLDLRTPAKLAIAEMDFTRDEPLSEDARARIEATFDPERIVLRLKPSRLRAADLDVDLDGALSFAGTEPAGTLTLRAAGLEKAIAALQAAAAQEPELHQAVGVLQMAQGFGRRTGEGRWEWIVEAAADGSVSVNGTTLKGPDPAPAPEDAAPPSGDEPTPL